MTKSKSGMVIEAITHLLKDKSWILSWFTEFAEFRESHLGKTQVVSEFSTQLAFEFIQVESEATHLGKFGELILWNEVGVEAGCPVTACLNKIVESPETMLSKLATFMESFPTKISFVYYGHQ